MRYLLIWISCVGLLSQEPDSVWKNFVEIPQAAFRHVLSDLPGSIIAFVAKPDGTSEVIPLGRKVLKKDTKTPKVQIKPSVLYSDILKKSDSVGLKYLSFVSASMSNTDEVKFSVTETAVSSVIDEQIDWAAFSTRVKNFQNKHPGKEVKFAVVRVANVILVEHQIFSKVSRAAKISGWGFNGEGKTLSEKTNSSSTYKVGVAVSFTEFDLEKAFGTFKTSTLKGNSFRENKFRLSNDLSAIYANSLTLEKVYDIKKEIDLQILSDF